MTWLTVERPGRVRTRERTEAKECQQGRRRGDDDDGGGDGDGDGDGGDDGDDGDDGDGDGNEGKKVFFRSFLPASAFVAVLVIFAAPILGDVERVGSITHLRRP